jgi:hypothetical protein
MFSPQYYLKHKCMHCYCGVVHHRGIPSTAGVGGAPGAQRPVRPTLSRDASMTPAEMEEAQPAADAAGGADKKKTAGGVAAAPFVWTRHTRRSRSQVR